MLEPGLTPEHMLKLSHSPHPVCSNHAALLSVLRTHLLSLAKRPPHMLFPMPGMSPSKISFFARIVFIHSSRLCLNVISSGKSSLTI